MQSPDIDYDLIIIGAGPIGLAAACAAQDRGLTFVILDKAGLCQTISEFAPRQSFYSPAEELVVGNIPFPIAADEKPRREDALAYYRAVAAHRKLPLRTWERAVSIQRQGQSLQVSTIQEPDQAWERTYQTRTVLLTTGVWDQPRRLDVPGASLKKVHVRYEDPIPFYDRECLVVGGGNSAAEVAMALSRSGAKTQMALIEESFDVCKLRPFVLRELLILVEEQKIFPRFGTRVTAITPLDVRLEDMDKNSECIPNDFVFTMIGNDPDLKFLAAIGVQTDPQDLKPVYDPETFETNIPGIYVAGSISREPHIVNGRPRAVKIVEDIARRVRDRRSLTMGHVHSSRFITTGAIDERDERIETSMSVAVPANITVPSILININHTYKPGMSGLDLYQVTRQHWVISPERHTPQPRYAFATYQGIIQEVYEIESWHPSPPDEPGRKFFVGTVASDLAHHVGQSVTHIMAGLQNPIKYVNC